MRFGAMPFSQWAVGLGRPGGQDESEGVELYGMSTEKLLGKPVYEAPCWMDKRVGGGGFLAVTVRV